MTDIIQNDDAPDITDTPRYRTVEEIESRQSDLKSQLNELTQQTAGRVTSDDEKARWNSLNEEFDELTVIATEMEAMQARMAQVSQAPNGREQGAHFNVARQRATSNIYDIWSIRQAARGPSDEARMLSDNAMRAVERANFPHPDIDNDEARGHIERLMHRFEGLDENAIGADESNVTNFARHILMTGSPEYRRAFGKTMLGRMLNPDEQRALSTTTTAGGFAVPFTLDPTIIPTSNGSVNPWRAMARVETIATTTWQGVSSAGVTATRRSEAAQTADGAPAFLQPTATPSRVDCFVPFSIEIGQDWGSLESEMATAIQDAKDDEEAASFATGNGVAPNPQGIVTAISAASVVTGATTATFAIADVFSVYNALPPRFKPRAQWVANETIWNLIRQFATATGPSALVDSLQPGLGGTGVPRPGNINATLLGRGANESSAMSSSTATGALNLIIGDFRYFLIVDRIGMTVDLIPHLFGTLQMPTGQRGIFAYWRNTSVCLSTNAFRMNRVK